MSNVGDIVMEDNEYKVVTTNGSLASIGDSVTVTAGVSGIAPVANTILMNNTFSDINIEDLMEKWIMNRVTIDHKVQEQELMKLKEVAPDYANEIKENLAKNAARDMIKKVTFTKKHDKDADVHHFIGRVWCFTEQELKDFIKEARNV